MKINIMIMAVLLAFAAEAKVVTGTPFADNMVLQRGRAVPVWGKADPGEEVTVSFAGIGFSMPMNFRTPPDFVAFAERVRVSEL